MSLPARPVSSRPTARVTALSLAAFVALSACSSSATPASPTPSVATASRANLPAPDPNRFQQDILLEGVFDEPTEIAVAHDGRVFIVERHGTFSMYDPAT